jgi:phospholipid-binding lipoprotein MlaA
MRIIFFTLLIVAMALPAWAQNKGLDEDRDMDIHMDMGDLFEDYSQIEQEESVPDPIAGFNRFMYRFNDRVYLWVFKPVSKGYERVTTQQLRTGIENMFDNLMFPVRFVNSLLQGKIKGAGSEVGIFTINSTLGLLGFFPVAQDDFNLKNSEEDLGQTFGVCGIKDGFYIVLPILGPTTLRDLVGDVGDRFITPLTYVSPYEAYIGLKIFESVNILPLRIRYYESMKEAAVDPYVAMKNAYIQYRHQKVSE